MSSRRPDWPQETPRQVLFPEFRRRAEMKRTPPMTRLRRYWPVGLVILLALIGQQIALDVMF
jgi:hypothetical protein